MSSRQAGIAAGATDQSAPSSTEDLLQQNNNLRSATAAKDAEIVKNKATIDDLKATIKKQGSVQYASEH